MTTSNINGMNGMGGMRPQQGAEGVEGKKGPRGPKPEGAEGKEEAVNSSVSSSNTDTYTPSADALAYLAEQEEAAANSAEESDTADSGTSGGTGSTSNEDIVKALKADLAVQEQDFMNKMVSMITGQATASMGGGLSQLFDEMIVDATTQAEAQEAVSEDGYWGVEETANRIVDMAKALAGDDPDKAEEMMAAIEKGFAAAEKAWGSELPSITGDTKTRIDELFADWTSGSES